MLYRYCPNCGQKYSEQKNIHALVCTACGQVLYANSKPTASTLIIKDDKVLLGTRTREPEKGKWDVIGGFLDFGEDPKVGAVREAKEETGLDIVLTEQLGIFMDTYEDYATLNICYLASVIGGQAVPGDDINELKWFKPSELPGDIAFKNGREMIAAWQAKIKQTKI